ncbi:MAG: hypothetical protein ABF260_06280 [Flavobacteriaceae bacterium]
MANHLKSFIEVKGNEEVLKLVDSLVDKVNYSNEDAIVAFAKAFYDDVALGENGRSVMNEWSYENLGPKWTQLCDVQGKGMFSIESAWYPPKQFFFHLFNLCFPLDNNVVIEVKYEDEGFDPVGAMALKAGMTEDENEELVLAGHVWGEETVLEDPTVDMDWEDEDYDQTQMEFYETLAETQDKLLTECLRLVDSDGMLFDQYDR